MADPRYDEDHLFWVCIHNVECFDAALPQVARDADVADYVDAGNRVRKATSYTLVFGKCMDGSDVTVQFRTPVCVYLAIPSTLSDAQVRQLAKLDKTIVSSERVMRANLRGYVAPAPGEPTDQMVKVPYARLQFRSEAAAGDFFRARTNWDEPGHRAPNRFFWNWDDKLEAVGIPPPSVGDPWAYGVHHLETQTEALMRGISESAGCLENTPNDMASFTSWIALRHFSPEDNGERFFVTYANAHGTADLDQVVQVSNTRHAQPFTTLSYDLEITSKRRQFPQVGAAEDPIICCAVSLSLDEGKTVSEEVICVGEVSDTPGPDELEDAAPVLLTCVPDEPSLINEVGARFCNKQRKKGGFPMFNSGYNTTGFDNRSLVTRAYLFWLCHRESFGNVRGRVLDAVQCILRYEKVKILRDTEQISKREFKQIARKIFGVGRDEYFDANVAPMSERLLASAYPRHALEPDGNPTHRFTRADHDYFSSGPDTAPFFRCGLVPTVRTDFFTKRFKAGGRDMTSDHFGNGLVVLDMWKVIRDSGARLDDFSLKATSKLYLEQSKKQKKEEAKKEEEKGEAKKQGENEKIDMDYTEMMDMWDSGNPHKRRKVAVYCARDATLPIHLAKRLTVWSDLREFVRLHSICPRDRLFKGQQELMKCMYRKYMAAYGIVDNARRVPPKVGKFKGATVQAAMTGFFDCPVVTIDFKSLYPSIIDQFNLGFSTFLGEGEKVPPGVSTATHKVDPHEDDVLGETKHYRVVTSYPDLMPRVLRSLLDERARAKKEMKKHPRESIAYAQLNSRQLALKISANSQYGATGAKAGTMRDPRISATTTAIGRDLIERTKQFCAAKGFPTVYGDTDSVFLLFKGYSIEGAFTRGASLCEEVNNECFGAYPKIEIEIDYVFSELLLKGKKAYAGRVLQHPKDNGKLMYKGMSVVRRNYCKFQREATSAVFEQMMPDDRSLSTAIADAAPRMAAELTRQLDKVIDDVLPVRAYSTTVGIKNAEDYAQRNAGAELAQRVNQRIMDGKMKAASMLRSGDRMPTVKVEVSESGIRSNSLLVCLESPLYIEQNPQLGLRVDRLRYLGLLEESLSSLVCYHIPDVRSYFDRARDIIATQNKGAQLMARYLQAKKSAHEADRAKRWMTLKPSRVTSRKNKREGRMSQRADLVKRGRQTMADMMQRMRAKAQQQKRSCVGDTVIV